MAAARKQRGRQLQRLLGHVLGVQRAAVRLRREQRSEDALTVTVLRRQHEVAVGARRAGAAQIVRV